MGLPLIDGELEDCNLAGQLRQHVLNELAKLDGLL